MSKKIVFSGIKSSGNMHIGNYFGAVRRWASQQEEGLNIFCVVDLHAITVKQEPEKLKDSSLQTAALLVAAGIDPEESIIFMQSHNPDHANLGWILNCFTSMGQMRRMTQYKDKSRGKDFVSVGLFDYPVLMTADILLYDTTQVPVGQDQKQHVELARDIAERFNKRYGETFTIPKAIIPKTGARIMSLVDPSKKMSKSDANKNAWVSVLEKPETVKKKIMSAITDSDNEVVYDPDKKPGISNLIEIFSLASGISIQEVEKRFENKNYGEFKTQVAESVIKVLQPIQKNYNTLRKSDNLSKILEKGAKKSHVISHKKLIEVYKKVGFVTS